MFDDRAYTKFLIDPARQKTDALLRRVQLLEIEKEMLEARIDEIVRGLTTQTPTPIEWELTATEERVLGLLLSRETCTKEAIHNVVNSNKIVMIRETDIKIVDIFICKLRAKLAKHFDGELITTLWGRGYSISPHAKKLLKSKIEAYRKED